MAWSAVLLCLCETAAVVAAAGAETLQAGAAVVYVDDTAIGANDGSTWFNAFPDLQDALRIATASTQVWVARGNYRAGTTRSASFQVGSGVEVYGGLAGVEDPATFNLADRNFVANVSVLDGVLGSGSTSERSYHIVTASGVDASTVLDGFTITGARADGLTLSKQDVGGGLLIVDGSMTVANCRFVANSAGRGGAVHMTGNGRPTLVNCAFLGNSATVEGGAIYSAGPSPDIVTASLVNCLFSGNTAGVDGGAILNTSGSRMTLTNCTLGLNTAGGRGGAVFHEFGLLILWNAIVWGNEAGGLVDQTAQLGGGLPAVRHSCVQGLSGALAGNNNIGADPRFVQSVGADGVGGTDDDDLRLAPGSPCIDAGNNDTPIRNFSYDLDGGPRFVDDPNTPNTGNPPGGGALVDMGAYEYRQPCETDAECDDDDPCTTQRCEPSTNQCAFQRIVCDDGVFCNGQETCVDGACGPGTPPTCSDGLACTDDSCDATADACDHVLDDAMCNDGLYCNGIEVCDPVVGCRTGTPVSCDDGVGCTVDTCDEAEDSCKHVPNAGLCDDGSFCNGVETCDAESGCQSSGDPCSAPLVCDAALGACVGCLLDNECDDDDACTTDACAQGVCTHGEIPDCCTADDDCPQESCVQSLCVAGGCVNSPAADGTSCGDGLFCNGAETCQAGVCAVGTDPCGAGAVCNEQADRCDAVSGCQGPDDCPDANPCTDDLCSGGVCAHVDNTSACDDGEACTEDDTCSGGACAGTLIPDCASDTLTPAEENTDTDIDTDGDDVADDDCPDPPAGQPADDTACSPCERDSDGDGTPDCGDGCPDDAQKTAPGQCGCGNPDTDSDDDGTSDCADNCPQDAAKTVVGRCGCGLPDEDLDGDQVPDCEDRCLDTAPGQEVDDTGCPRVDAFDDPAGATAVRPQCGVCGAFGMITWVLLLALPLAEKVKTARSRHARCSVERIVISPACREPNRR